MPWPSLWPFGSKQSQKDDTASSSKDKLKELKEEVLSNDGIDKVKEGIKSTSWDDFATPQTLVGTVILTSGILVSIRFYKRYLRRIPNVKHIKPEELRTRSIFGKVTSVGDGDNFRIFHTPGGRLAGWGWLPGRTVPTEAKELKDKTLHLRIAGIDAPELAHFGRPAQPYGQEALDFLTQYVGNKRVRAYIYRKDQYERVVGTAWVRKWGIRRDVGLEMLKRGLATVYEAKYGSEFGSKEEQYRQAEQRAREKGVGMWKEPSVWQRILGANKTTSESPREYKTRMKDLEKAESAAKK